MPAVIEIDYDGPTCPHCGGVKIYRTSRNCVKCMKRIAHKKIQERVLEQKAAKALIAPECPIIGRQRPFALEEIRDDAFRNAERRIMAGVKFEDMERVTL